MATARTHVTERSKRVLQTSCPVWAQPELDAPQHDPPSPHVLANVSLHPLATSGEQTLQNLPPPYLGGQITPPPGSRCSCHRGPNPKSCLTDLICLLFSQHPLAIGAPAQRCGGALSQGGEGGGRWGPTRGWGHVTAVTPRGPSAEGTEGSGPSTWSWGNKPLSYHRKQHSVPPDGRQGVLVGALASGGQHPPQIQA